MRGTLYERVWSKIQVGAPTECWPFTGHHTSKGYGRLARGTRGEGSVFAHRVVAEEFHGPCPPGQWTRHLCGNKACCNPRHLAWGDQSANERDKITHGRDNRGERNALAKLKADEVRAIRLSLDAGTRQVDVAAEFGVTQQTVSMIKTRNVWGWLD